jgi:diguanylate cyclase (GGDEF)-like protein/PAS domain S-box-containing protein
MTAARGSEGTVGALSGGGDAVLLARIEPSGALSVEVVNDAGRALLGAGAGDRLGDETVPAELTPLLARVREAATRARATREQVALATPAGRAVVDLQLEPLPQAAGRPQVLAVIRLAGVPADTAPPAVGVLRYETGLGAVFVDDAVLSLLGLTQEQALGHGWLDALHADDRDSVRAALERGDPGDDALHLECRVVRGGVDERPARIRAVPVRGDDGRCTGYLASVEDLTEEHRNLEAVTRLSELADVLDEWIVIADPDLRLRYANPAARHGLSLPPPDGAPEIKIVDLVPVPHVADLASQLRDAVLMSRPWTGDLVMSALDGRTVEVQCTVVAHRDDRGEIAHYSFLGRDVSSLRSVQRALDESEARFRLIADSSPTGIYFVADGGLVNYANRRLAEILGDPVERVVGRSFLEWVHPDDLARIVETGELIAAQPRDTNVEMRIRRANGEIRWLRAQGAPVTDRDGHVHGFVGSVVDVTDERAWQRGLVMLNRAIESTTDLVTFHDRAGRMFFANAAAREFFGIGMAEPVPPLGPTDYLDLSSPTLADLEPVLETKGQWSGELVAVNRSGRRIPVEVVVVAHRDERGEVEYYSALSRDLSERKVAEAARRRSETVLRAIVQASPLAIFALDRRATVHVWNHAAVELFGWTAEEAVGGPPLFVDDEARDELDGVLARVFRGRTVKGYPARFSRRDGERVDVELSIAPLRNAAGRVVTAVAVLADVTEQVRATQAVHESEVWFRSLVQHSTDMVMVIGADGTLRYLSPSACEFAGTHLHDVLGRRVNEVFEPSPDDRPGLQEAFTRLWSRPRSTERATFRIVRGDGAQRWIEMSASNLIDDSAVEGIVVNARDVTESFEADAAVRASEERLRALVSSVSDGIVVLDADGAVVYSSPVADEMFASASAGDPESVFAAVDAEDLPRARELWEHTRATPGVSPLAHVRIRRGDGVALDAEVVANNLLDDPSVRGIVMTIRDVTERNTSERALRRSEDELRASEARYRAVVDDQIELVCRYRADTAITFVNRAFADFYGRSRDELVGSLLVDLHPPTVHDEILARIRRFGAGHAVQTHDEWELGADGSRRCYRWIDRAFLDERGEVVEVQSVGHDVTEERRASILTANQAGILEQVARGLPLEETLTAIASTLEQHFPKLSCALYLLDADGETLHLAASPTLARDVVSDAAVDPVWSVPILAADGRTALGSLAVFGRDAEAPDEEQRHIFSLGAHLAAIAIERKAFEERLAHQSMHDPLTGLPNRVLFLDRLGIALARGRRTQTQVAVLFLDLDRFKNVNDSVGHDAGDELLVSVARRLEAVLRPGDTVARFGGDEFTVLCEDLSRETARDRAGEIAQRLLDAMGHPFVVRDAETYVSASVGIALADGGDETADELLRDADAAMYAAKEAGRGRVAVFDDAIRERALARHATENALHRAIERGELRLFFQPIVRLDDARCVGVEALVRWQHPERGLVAPSEFVPLAEETGLVVPLGTWVVEQAAAQAARWQLEHDGFSVSVNLSARQLAQPDLPAQVADVIRRNGVDPKNLCFEITESALMDDADAVMRVIEHLRALGVRFAIDDFGTGYSSLGYLKRFAVDTVKIDRAFIDGLSDDPGDRAIVSAVVGLAHELGLRVVAEGVETEAQLVELVALGCDEAQGYFFAPPQPAHDLRTLVSATRRWRPPGSRLMRGNSGVTRP